MRGETVLDFSAGSMTCAIAGIDENRKVICIEKDEKIFGLGKNRVIKHQKEKGTDLCIK
jgi:DNA modification methylase